MKPFLLLIVALIAMLGDVILQYFLWFYPAPSGTALVSDPASFFKLGVYYSAAAISLVTLPFMLLACWKKTSPKWLCGILAFVLAVYVTLNHADHEYMRQVGTHYALEMLGTYDLSSSTVMPLVLHALGADTRGAYSAFTLALIPWALFAVTLIFRKRLETGLYKLQNTLTRHFKGRRKCLAICKIAPFFVAFATVGALAGSGVAVVFKVSDKEPGKIIFNPSRRQLKTAPVFLTMLKESTLPSTSPLDAETVRPYIERVQKDWLSRDNGNWKFISTDKPFDKTYIGQKETANPWRPQNIIVIVVESLRGLSLPQFNEKQPIQPMPFLQSITDQTAPFLQKNGLHSAYWKHYNTNSQPTIDAFMSLHTGIAQHSSRTIASSFSNNRLTAIPQYLKRYGYETNIYLGGDATLDSQAIWSERWYDSMQYFIPWDDRLVFDAMEKDIIPGTLNHPETLRFSLTFLVTNHIAWTLPKDLGIDQSGKTLMEKMYQTMAFDDTLIRQFIEKLDNAGILRDSLLIITGDHGYEFGEYEHEKALTNGHEACRRNVTWVPMIMISNRPQMPSGPQTETASHVDVAPTILAALNIYDDNSFTGHDMWSTHDRLTLNMKYGNYAIENNRYAAVFSDPTDRLYDNATDYTQENNIAAQHPEIVKTLWKLATDYRAVIDYAYERGMF